MLEFQIFVLSIKNRRRLGLREEDFQIVFEPFPDSVDSWLFDNILMFDK